MSDLFQKISSYNILNYLVPGVIFALLSAQLTSFPILISEPVLGLFLYYLYGMIISRVGSIIIEPVFKFMGILKYPPYAEFVEASKKDPKIEILSETNNVYRTMISLLICLFALWGLDELAIIFPKLLDVYLGLLALFLFILFTFSYRKQAKYIGERIRNSIRKSEGV